MIQKGSVKRNFLSEGYHHARRGALAWAQLQHATHRMCSHGFNTGAAPQRLQPAADAGKEGGNLAGAYEQVV